MITAFEYFRRAKLPFTPGPVPGGTVDPFLQSAKEAGKFAVFDADENIVAVVNTSQQAIAFVEAAHFFAHLDKQNPYVDSNLQRSIPAIKDL